MELRKFMTFKQKPILTETYFRAQFELSLSLKLRKYMLFKPKEILIKTFVESHFEIM